jgi:hypothetical protein
MFVVGVMVYEDNFHPLAEQELRKAAISLESSKE